MNFEWVFSRKTVCKSSNKTFQTIIFVTQITIFISLLITIFTFSIGFGFKNIIRDKLLNIKGQITVVNKISKKKFPINICEKSNSLLKEFFLYDYDHVKKKIKNVYPFAENDIIIGKDHLSERFIFKGVYEDYNPIFFHYFLIGKIKNNLLSDNNIILSSKNSLLLGLNIGSNVKINFIFFHKKLSAPIIVSKIFRVNGLYETGISEFDDLYIIGNIKYIQSIYGWKKGFSEGCEIFMSDFFQSDIIMKKESSNFLLKYTNYQCYNSFITWINVFSTNINIIVFIILITLIINMITFFLILLLERRKTIGILKTIGSKNKIIYNIFIFYIIRLFVFPLILGDIISISLLKIQKIFHILSLNKTQYFIDYVPVDLNFFHIIMINLSIIFICFFTVIFIFLFFINKIYPKRVLNFE
ncbi:ABC transporter permease [Blattabacterium cuenoti]|uniref:ABC transporter permease n=1 Tax=Blattabacterium cuenoti TaxID=1653831 RepID=UPI00163BF435|nr:FtsX-like permease family protein [Blattabacterium cuenoti]